MVDLLYLQSFDSKMFTLNSLKVQYLFKISCIDHILFACGVTLVIKHDVFRFQVSVNNPIGVEMTEGQRDLS